MSVLKFARWFHYTGTRQLVRGWKFVDDYEPLNVTAGQCLFEDEDGFEVRDADASVASVRHIEDWQVEPLLAEAGTPAWDDVAELYERAVEVVKDFADVLVKTTEHPNLWETLKEHLDDAMNDAKVHDSIAAKHRQRLANTPNARHQYAYPFRFRDWRLPADEEPDVHDLLIGDRSRAAEEVDPEGARKEVRLWNARKRIQAKFNRDMRERGKTCRACGEHFRPRRVDQARCPNCIEAAKKVGAR